MNGSEPVRTGSNGKILNTKIVSKSLLKSEKLRMVIVVHLRFPNKAMSTPLHSEFMENEADTKTYLNSETGSVNARLKLAQLGIFLLNFRSICY